jgi:hypothetical protein
VIDISGDGVQHVAGGASAVTQARDRALAQGITINGLPIEPEPKKSQGITMHGTSYELTIPEAVEYYYREFVIGGPGAFLIPAQNFWDVERAFKLKFRRDLLVMR